MATQQTLVIEGAHCAGCVNKIERALQSVEGVKHAEMNFADRTAAVLGTAGAEQLIAAVESVGYHAQLREDADTWQALNDNDLAERKQYHALLRDMAVALGLGLPLMAYGMITGDMSVNTTEQRLGWFVVGLLTLGVMLSSGSHFYRGAWSAARHGSTTMDTLIALGTGTAWLYSMGVVVIPDAFPMAARHIYFEASAMIIGLINLGQALELRARGRTSAAIRRLIDLRPASARVVRDGQDVETPVALVVGGDIVRIRPGERIPVDGTVCEGHTHIDESMLTGEPLAVSKAVDDVLFAGTVNGSGSVLMRATRVGQQTALAQIIKAVRRAQNSKPPIGRLADKISAWFVPLIIAIAVLSAAAWWAIGPEPAAAHAVVAATTVLIIACPCALGLATPLSIMVGVGKAAEAGILTRNGEALQSAATITTVVLDKTGTLTEGKPRVTDVYCIPDVDEETLIQLAASVEIGSEHPLADAVVACASHRGLPLSPARDFEAITGRGVRAQVGEHRLLIGKPALLSDFNIDTESLDSHITRFANDAKTPLCVAIDGQAAGLIAVADPIRADTRAALARLRDLGIGLIMITGDNLATARSVARQTGIDTVHADVMPQDKATLITSLQQAGESVGMAGDGINDAPALATADVGFAIGGGTDVAIESADVTLMGASLHGVADAIGISRATLRNIRQNLFGAFIYNVAGVPVAAGVLYPFFGVLLSPVVAGAAMALSSFTVVSNANRLRFYQPKNASVR